MPFIQTRICDGKCCEESPRFPNEDHSDCIYHIKGEEKGCKIMLGEAPVPLYCNNKKLPHIYTGAEAYYRTCLPWPHSTPGRDTGGCCWKWIDGD